MCEAATQKPVNPHRQRLLAASSRVAKVETPAPKSSSAKPKKKASKVEKEKEPAPVKKTQKPKKKAKATPKVCPAPPSDMKSKARDDYQNAKKYFFDTFLDDQYILVDCLKWWTSSMANIL